MMRSITIARIRVAVTGGLNLAVVVVPLGAIHAQSAYYPPKGDHWATRHPAAVGMDSIKVARALAFAESADNGFPIDIVDRLKQSTARELYPEILGPTKVQARTNGVITRRGYIVAELHATNQVDMSFSVAKSYLSVVAGLAFDRGLIDKLDAVEGGTIQDGEPYWEDPRRWLEQSPIMYVGNVKTPTMLMTSELDLRTPMGQTEEYLAALKFRRVPAVMVRFEGEYHVTTSKPSNWMRTQAYMKEWFRWWSGKAVRKPGLVPPQ